MEDRKHPHSIDLEQAALGAILLDRDAIHVVISVLNVSSFFIESHQVIFQACINLFEKAAPIDLLTVSEELKRMNKLDEVGGFFYLTELTNRVASSANLEYHARLISQFQLRRGLIQISEEGRRDAYSDENDIFNLIESYEQNLFNLTQGNLTKSWESSAEAAKKAVEALMAAREKPDGLVGVPSGFQDLDRLTGGWGKTDLIILAARPGMGKTSLAIKFLLNASIDFDKPVAMFSIEMSNLQLTNRSASILSGVQGTKIRKGETDDGEFERFVKAAEKIGIAPFLMDDTPSLSIFEIRSKARRMKIQHDIQLVVVDYLQLMRGVEKKGGNREQEISSVSRGLKQLAKELDVPVIALSQLNRSVETRGGTKRPQLSDLRESGSIEQDADMVAFLYRPEYYQIMEDYEGQSTKGKAEFIIAKNRHGALDTVELYFDHKTTNFQDMPDRILSPEIQDGLDMEVNEVFGVTPPSNNQDLVEAASKRNDDEDIPF